MAILQLIAEKEKSLCFDFLEEKIREESRKLIESIYADEVNQFLEKMASIVDGKGNKLVVRNGYHKSRVVQTACGNVEIKLPREWMTEKLRRNSSVKFCHHLPERHRRSKH